MKRNPAVWVVSGLLFLPFLWLVVTMPPGLPMGAWLSVAGAFGTGLALVVLLWRGHRAGRWVAHQCVTCKHPMRRVQEGELRPPGGPEAPGNPLWRCAYCGRLV